MAIQFLDNAEFSGTISVDNQGNSEEWNKGYGLSLDRLSVTGTTTKTLTATQQDGGTLTASWQDNTDSTFVFNQATPSTSWAITHNLGKFPSVTVVNSSKAVVYGNIDYINNNEATITFSAAFSGQAFLN